VFAWGVGLNVAFVLLEAGVGLALNSLALLADAGHNLSDVMGLIMAWGAHYLSQRSPTPQYTYGWRRSSILAALVNSGLLLLAMGAIAWEALQRLQTPSPLSGWVLVGVAGAGIVINGLTALLFMAGRHEDLNLRGAFLHMVADALVSLGVVLTGVAIALTGWLWVDPVISLVIVVVVVTGTWDLLRRALRLSLDGVPRHIQPEMVRQFLQEWPGVSQVHDLHIWAMSTTEVALTAHLVMPQGHPGDRTLADIAHQLQHQFTIHHSTLQIETGDPTVACPLAVQGQV
jgi:cobalt-zinc-cadmium efflux system protein